MKKLLFILCLIPLGLFGQAPKGGNYFKYIIKASGGIWIGDTSSVSTAVKIDSVTVIDDTLRFHVNGDILAGLAVSDVTLDSIAVLRALIENNQDSIAAHYIRLNNLDDSIVELRIAIGTGGGGDLAFEDTVSSTGFIETQFRSDTAKSAIRGEIAALIAGEFDTTYIHARIDSLAYDTLTLAAGAFITLTERNDSLIIAVDTTGLNIVAGGISDSTSLYFYHEIQPIYTFSVGHGNSMDSIHFMDENTLGAFFNRSADTLVITDMITGIYGSTGDTMRHQLVWHKTYRNLTDAVKLDTILIATGGTNSAYIYTQVNDTIPPDVWLWARVIGPLQDVRPYMWHSTIAGYRIKGTLNANPFDEDNTAPEFASAELGTYNDSIVMVLLDENLQQDSIPLVAAFTFTGGIAKTEIGINAITISYDTLFVALDSIPISYVDSVLYLSYTPGYPALQDSSENAVAAWVDSTVTNNLTAEESYEVLWKLRPKGDSTGVATIRLSVSETTTLTLDGVGRFYTNSAGTEGESTSWEITSGALRTRYIKVTDDSSMLTIPDARLITEFGGSSSLRGWQSETNMPTIGGDISKLINLTKLYKGRINAHSTFTGSIDDMSNLTAIFLATTDNIEGDITSLNLAFLEVSANTSLVGSFNSSTNMTRLNLLTTNFTGDLSNLTSATYRYSSGNLNKLTYSTHTWAASTTYLLIYPASGHGWSIGEISTAVNEASATTWASPFMFDCSHAQHASMADTNQGGIWGDFSGEAAPSTLATNFKTLVKTRSCVGVTSGVLLRGTVTPGETGDGTGFPAGFGDWWRE